MKIPILMYHEVYQSAEYERLRSLTNPAYNIAVGAFRRQMEWLSENTEEEDDLLDRAPGLTSTSRLGCQAVIREGEVVVMIPRYTINQQV